MNAVTLSPGQAWEKEMAKARLPKSNLKRVPYPAAAKAALYAWLAAGGLKAQEKR